jgi:hypothetical protein
MLPNRSWAPRSLAATVLAIAALLMASSSIARAQSPDDAAAEQHEHMTMNESRWQWMQDGVLFVMFNHQGSSRGGDDLVAPNWWMGMGQHRLGRGTLRVNLMLSLDPATVGTHGYREIFQAGETYKGNALIDRQHPHDFLMQAAAVWRVPVGAGYTVTAAGAPVGEPALGPVAFMHRASAFENPVAPLGHHTLDSTHIAMGVLTGAIEKGPVQIESSVFRGAEPDEQRWDLMDPGALDSWSVRGWYRPTPAWSFQVSHGSLTHPEILEEGDVRRSTASISWRETHDGSWTAVTAAWGRNRKTGGQFNAFLIEATRSMDRLTLSTRIERTQVEDDLLRTGAHQTQGASGTAQVVLSGLDSYVEALTLGATRTFWKPHSWDLAAGGDVTGYLVPVNLRPFYTSHPVSYHLYLRVRPPSASRMTEVTMIGQ